MLDLARLPARRWSAVRRLCASVVIGAVLAACSPAPAGAPAPTATPEPPAARQHPVLGTWLPPTLRCVEKGRTTAVHGWSAVLWLTHDERGDIYRYSSASRILSAIHTADQVATFITLRVQVPLQVDGAAVRAPGAAPLRPIGAPLSDLPLHSATQGWNSYVLSFPPLDPAWRELELSVPLADTDGALVVRFMRPSACEDFVTGYRQTLEAAPGTCSTSTDCGRYGGFDPADLCGGVTDAASAMTLGDIANSSDMFGCARPPSSCPLMPPACIDGVCRAPSD